MATQAERQNKIAEIIDNGLAPAEHRDWLESLTDNQLASIADPDGLDELVTVAANALEDDDDDAEDFEEDDDDDDDLTDNGGTMVENMSDDELMAELASRKAKKGKKKPSMNGKKPSMNGKKPYMDGKKNKDMYGGPDTNSADTPLEESEWFATAPPEVQRLLVNARAAEDAERDELIELITANDACEFTEPQLKSSKIETLRGLAKLAASGLVQRPVTANNYGGRFAGNSLIGNASGEEAPLELPNLGFDKSDA